MFEHISELVSKLSLENKGNYKQAKEARKVLQEIKIEAQRLRNQVSTDFKNAPKKEKVIKHKVTKEEVKENNLEGVVEAEEEIEIPEEPVLVDENSDEFFDKR